MRGKKSGEHFLMAVIVILAVILMVVLVLVIRKEMALRERGDAEVLLSEAKAEPESFTAAEGESQSYAFDADAETEAESQTEDKSQSGTAEQEEAVRKIVEEMTLEEKVCQLFVVTPEALTGYEQVTMAGEVTKQAYENMPVGGIVLMEQNLTTPGELTAMTANLHQYSTERIGVPVLVGLDEEGGTVARIGNQGNFDVPYIEDMSEVGSSGDCQQAYQTGSQLGDYLSSFGIDMDYAPVADVWWNSENTVVARRSFGSDPELVAQMVEEEVAALQEKGVSAVLKHFPGHGGTTGDSHNGFVAVYETMDEMWQNDLIPFQRGIAAGTDSVMVGHICTPEIEGEEMPATLSYYWITEILRNQMGFQGVVITDALNMGAITQSYSSADACVQAVQAGADLLLMPADFYNAYQGVLDAVNSGEISEERLWESVERIVRLKYRKTFGM